MVICSHLNLSYFHFGEEAPWLHRSVLHIFYDGEAAVVFFFVLSGFVLSAPYVQEDSRRWDTFRYLPYLVKRVFRIFPLLWVVIVLTFLVSQAIHWDVANIPERTWGKWWWHDRFHPWEWLRQGSLLYMRPDDTNYVPQSWSLTIEVVMSAFLPLMILMIRRNLSWLLLFAVLMMWVFQVYAYIFHFVLGIILAKYRLPLMRFYQQRTKWLLWITLLLGLVFYTYRYSIAAWFPVWSVLQYLLFSETSILLITGLGTAALLVFAMQSPRFQQVMQWPFLRLAGRVSYSLYLGHLLVLVLLTPLFVYFLNRQGLVAPFPVLLLATVFTLSASLALAVMLYYVVERPFMQWGKRIASRFEP